MLPLAYDPERVAAEASRVLSETTAGLTDRYPDLNVGHRVIRGRLASTPITHTNEAQLIVVGARGRGEFSGLLLGSESVGLLGDHVTSHWGG